MRHRCVSAFVPAHSSLGTQCTYCDKVAVFHWRDTYPDVLLCMDCLELYPEAQGERLVLRHSITRQKRDPS